MHDPHLSISFSQNIFIPTKNIFLCVAFLLGGLCPRLTDHRSQAELQLTQQTRQLGVKHRTPPLILRGGEGETQPLEWLLLLLFISALVVFGGAPKISYQNLEGRTLSEVFLTKHHTVETDSLSATQEQRLVGQPGRGCWWESPTWRTRGCFDEGCLLWSLWVAVWRTPTPSLWWPLMLQSDIRRLNLKNTHTHTHTKMMVNWCFKCDAWQRLRILRLLPDVISDRIKKRFLMNYCQAEQYNFMMTMQLFSIYL